MDRKICKLPKCGTNVIGRGSQLYCSTSCAVTAHRRQAKSRYKVNNPQLSSENYISKNYGRDSEGDIDSCKSSGFF